MNKKNKVKLQKSTYGFIAPAFILYSLFVIVPTISSVYYSFTSWDGISPVVRFIGLNNYKEILTSARFGNALKNTVILTIFISLLENAFALGLALLVDNVKIGKNFFRSAFYIPVLISGIVSGFIWKIMYNYNFGAINTILNDIGTLSLINGLKVFDQINVMTDGGPGFTTETLVYLLYKVGFNEGRQGFGTAVGMVLLFIIIILNSLQQKFLKSREVQL